MSWLGEFRRLSPATLAEIQAAPEDAYGRVTRLDEMLDLDRAWRRLAALMDLAGFPLNPITAGRLFPDEENAWGQDGDSRVLTVEQVAEAAAHLSRTPFDVLGGHLRALLGVEHWVRLADPAAPLRVLPPPPPEAATYRVEEETERAVRATLAEAYGELAEFFAVAAAEGECTVFWAA